MHVSQVTLKPRAFSMGSFLGTQGSAGFIKRMASEAGNVASSYFGSDRSPVRTGYRNFMAQVVEPIREISEKLQTAGLAIARENKIVPITSMADLQRGVPPCMYAPILTYAPMRSLLKENRIDGWGVHHQDLPEEDDYGRLIKNGQVDLSKDSPDWVEPDVIKFTWTWKDDDPDLSREELTAIQDTREFFEEFLLSEDTGHLDPTDLPNLRG